MTRPSRTWKNNHVVYLTSLLFFREISISTNKVVSFSLYIVGKRQWLMPKPRRSSWLKLPE